MAFAVMILLCQLEMTAPETISNANLADGARERLTVEQAMLYEPLSEWTYSHHPSLAFFKDRYYAMWSNGRTDEDAPGQRVLYSTSDDFVTWSAPRPLVDSMMGEQAEAVLTASGFHAQGGELVAYFGRYEYAGWTRTSGRPAGDTRHTRVGLWAITTTDGEHWSATRDLGLPIVPNHPPAFTRSGRLILPGHTAYPYTDDPGGFTGWKMTGIYPPEMRVGFFDDSEGFHLVQRQAKWPVGLCEGSFFQTADGVLHMLLRSGTPRLWMAESNNDGATWSPPRPTEFSDNVAKFHFGQLPDGRYYYVGNPDPEPAGRRNPLVLSTSADGAHFGRHYILADAEVQAKHPGMYKGGAYAYPHSIVQDDKLCVIVSVGKESVMVIRLAVP